MIGIAFITGVSVGLEFDFDSRLVILDLGILRFALYYGSDPTNDLS